MNIRDIHNTSQQRSIDQLTFHRREIPPLLKNSFIYHDYAYGWIPETVLWNSQYENLDIRNYYPITLGLLNKFDFLLGLNRGPPPQYTPKINIQYVNQAPMVRLNDYYKKFAILPTNELISFLLLTTVPIYNILYFFKTTVFNPRIHSLLNEFYVDDAKHIELAKYLIRGGDYKPIFSRLDQRQLYDNTLPNGNMYSVQIPQGANAQQYLINIEALSNLSTIITYTKQDPVLTFLIFYLPGLSVTTKITSGVEMLMEKLGLTKENIVLV
ncbi:ORF-54 [Teiidae poxvirus 1]|nr:ORF-54 [Teiidae poxvirus 1]